MEEHHGANCPICEYVWEKCKCDPDEVEAHIQYEEMKAEITSLRNQLAEEKQQNMRLWNLRADRNQDTSPYREKIEELESQLTSAQEEVWDAAIDSVAYKMEGGLTRVDKQFKDWLASKPKDGAG